MYFLVAEADLEAAGERRGSRQRRLRDEEEEEEEELEGLFWDVELVFPDHRINVRVRARVCVCLCVCVCMKSGLEKGGLRMSWLVRDPQNDVLAPFRRCSLALGKLCW